MLVKDFDQAIEWDNSAKFALTGAVFSRSPGHQDKARREFRPEISHFLFHLQMSGQAKF